nr:hypothetical protein [Desulfobulbaceae bacterium]
MNYTRRVSGNNFKTGQHMFIVNLFGFVMITSTIVIGVLFFSKASAIEKEIELELLAAAKNETIKESAEDYDLEDSPEDPILSSDADTDEEEETII